MHTITGRPYPWLRLPSYHLPNLIPPRASLWLMTTWGRAWKPARGYKVWQRRWQGADLWEQKTGLHYLEVWEDSFQPLELLSVRKGTRLNHFNGHNGRGSQNFKVGMLGSFSWAGLTFSPVVVTLVTLPPGLCSLYASTSQPNSIHLKSQPYASLFCGLFLIILVQ